MAASAEAARPGPELLREVYLVGVTAHERAGDWAGLLSVLRDMARALPPPQRRGRAGRLGIDPDERYAGGGGGGGSEADVRLARTCNRAVTYAVRERRWEQVRRWGHWAGWHDTPWYAIECPQISSNHVCAIYVPTATAGRGLARCHAVPRRGPGRHGLQRRDEGAGRAGAARGSLPPPGPDGGGSGADPRRGLLLHAHPRLRPRGPVGEGKSVGGW